MIFLHYLNRKSTVLLVCALFMIACGDESLDSEAPDNNRTGFNNGAGNNADEPGGNNDHIPEQEEDFEFSAPAVVDDRVYVANETLNSVAVIDSRNLSISNRLVGFRPTEIAGPDTERTEPDSDARVMVLNEGSRSVSILATDSDKVVNVPVMARANSLAVDPAGRTALAWYDPAEAKANDPAGDLSSVSVVIGDTSHEVSVGFHVRSVHFDDAASRALVLSDDGISQIDLEELGGDVIAPPTPVVPEEYETSRPEDLEVLVSADGEWAITRSASFAGAVLLDIDTGEHHFLPLPEIPTDIDLIEGDEADELRVLIMLRGQSKAVVASIPAGFSAAADAMSGDPQTQLSLDAGYDAGSDAGSDAGFDAGADTGSDAGSDAGSDTGSDAGSDARSDADESDSPVQLPTGIDGFEVFDVEVDAMGAASVARDGQTALLYSTIGDEKRAVLFEIATGDQETLAFEKGVRGALSDRNGQTFLVFHSKVDGPIPPDATPADPEYIARSWGVSVVDIASGANRLVLTKHKPGPATLWAPDDGDPKVFLIYEAPENTTDIEPSQRDVLTINLRSFRTDSFRVPSLPEGLGPVRDAGRIYVSQRHPQGRMTFIDAETGARQTITGYQLNAGID